MFLLFLACTEPETSSSSETPEYDPALYIDLRKDYPDPPDGGLAIRSSVFEIPPYSENIYCYFGTYDGPTTGVNFYQPLQGDLYSHHNQLKTTPVQQPDGTLEDCSYLGASMSDFVPLFEAVGIEAVEGANGNWLNFPDGIAMRLEEQKEYVIDMHYINTSDKILVVQNGANLGLLADEEIDHYASSAQFDSGPPQITPGDYIDVFDCEWHQDATILSISAHMHSAGTAFYIDHIKTDGTIKRIHSIPEWDAAVYPYFPIIDSYDIGELEVEEGDIFRTTCEWYNPTEHILSFPAEMCTTAVVAYPLDNPISCIDGVYLEN
jgi:hypothetical protein